MGEVQAGANHLVSCVFGFFAVFGDVISQAAQTFLPGTVSAALDLPSNHRQLRKLAACGMA